jgi:hypothetical protein
MYVDVLSQRTKAGQAGAGVDRHVTWNDRQTERSVHIGIWIFFSSDDEFDKDQIFFPTEKTKPTEDEDQDQNKIDLFGTIFC